MSEIDELKHDIEHKKLAVRNRKVTIKELKKDKEMLKADLNNAYITVGNQSREIERQADVIKELEAQIEEMKCPQNCKNGSVYNWSDNSICMDCEKVRTLHEDNWQEMCKGCKYWELVKEIKENG